MENNIFKQSAILMKDNLMVIQPVFFWVLIMMMVIAPVASKTSVDIGFILSIIAAALCFTAFLAGWYNCVKKTVDLKNKKYETIEDKNRSQIEILKSFFPGVGEYMIPISIMAVIYAFLAYITMSLYRSFSFKIFTLKHFPSDMLTVINTGTQADISKYLQTNLSHEQLLTLSGLILGAFIVYFAFSMFVLWLAPAIIYSDKNPFIAIGAAVKFLFHNFLVSVQIVAVMFLINMIISIMNFLIGNGFLSFIPLLLSFMYIMYYVITVFLYYESKTKNSCPDGSKFNRQV